MSQYRFFNIPVHDDGTAAETLNLFLRQHRIENVDRRFVDQGSNSLWVFCVAFEGEAPARSNSKKSRIDYREVLSDQQFAVFARLRDWRKQQAQQEGVPTYMVFTNEQLAEMVRHPVSTMADLGRIEGVGQGRLNKYGEAVLALLQKVVHHASEGQDAP